MKYTNGKRGLLQVVALGQVFLLVAAGCKSSSNSGVNPVAVTQALDGDLTVTDQRTVNGYAPLAFDATAGATSVRVTTLLAPDSGAYSGLQNLAVGDLVLIIQMAGATIDPNEPNNPNDPNNYVSPAPYGSVTSLGTAGNYELTTVASIAPSTNTIGLTCALKKSYSAAGKTQVVRVPQYNKLTIAGGTDGGTDAGIGSITATPWDSTTGVGGVVALSVADTLQLDGDIDVSGQGFHGGGVSNAARAPATDVPLYRSNDPNDGGEKGESIAGLAAELTAGRYGRGAPANAGGGGNSHNAGGGGGANATSASGSDAALSDAWTGQGVMLHSLANDATAWQLDPAYTAPTIDRYTTSSGGGRGGYTYSLATPDPTVVGPNNGAWTGNNRREHGGLGGHPLVSSTSDANGKSARLFLGGGGGAGNGNDGYAGPGGPGGGLVFVIVAGTGTVKGSGKIKANGGSGGDSDSRLSTPAHGDAAGGGGGGGTVVVHAGTLQQISVEANGGDGGNQLIAGTNAEAEGPGGGGGGGYIALSGGTAPTVSAKGGGGGSTDSTTMIKFPSNGATAGHDGLIESAADILYCTSPGDGGVDAQAQEAGIEVGANDATADGQAIDGPLVLQDAGVPDAGIDASPGLDSADGPVVFEDAGVDASPGLDSADGPGTVVFEDAGADATPELDSADGPATGEDGPGTGEDGPGTVVFEDGGADVAAAVDLGPSGGQDVPPIGTVDAAADASDAGAVGLVDAILDGSGGDANPQDAQAVVFLDARSSDASAGPDQAVLPPDAAMAVDAPVVPGPDAQANISFKAMGSGFCAVNPMCDSAPGLFTFFLVAAFGLLLRRRRR